MALHLEIEAIQKVYPSESPEGRVEVFHRIDLSVDPGQFVSIVGPSGCGKTTLLRIVAGLEARTSGRILLDGRESEERDRRIGMVFQDYALFPWRTAVRNIEIGLEIQGMPQQKRRSLAMKYVRVFGLEGFADKYPKELSGGMKQRVAIARTLVANPEVVLMDEPFGSLDSQTRNRLQDFLLRIWRERKDTILFVTHNVDEAVYLSDRIAVLSPRPAAVCGIFDVALERPRDRTGPEANRIRKEILELLHRPHTSPVTF
ncbi:MAG: ABC transporter ATP-binding protein [Desulfobacteraceae bacterium]|jgi:NitT/TauT family transport system ATP-binding protein|nr:ABC transporter ATP-binding protein [Desulfobacteraceae bacterium]